MAAKIARIKKSFVLRIVKLFLFVFLAFCTFFAAGKLYLNRDKIIAFVDNRIVDPGKKDPYLFLVNELARKQITVSYLNFLDTNTVEASLSSGIKVIFSLDKDVSKAVTSLQLILSRFRIEGRKIKSIDLRFKNAIVE